MISKRLCDAAKRGDATAARAALDGGASPESRGGRFNETALHFAAAGGHSAVARLLLDRGAAVNSTTVGGETPLHWATRGGHVDCVQLLLERGADVVAANTTGDTPLRYAAQDGHAACVELLLEHNAAADARDNYWNRTPLLAAAYGGHAQCVRLLLQRGALIDARDLQGWTPLHQAVSSRFDGRAVVLELLWRGADAAVTDNAGRTPTAIAAHYEKHDVANMLAAWLRGELRVWSRAAHAMFPAAFRADVRATLLAMGATSSANGLASAQHNPLRMLRDHHLLDEVFKALFIAHMGGPATLVVQPSS